MVWTSRQSDCIVSGILVTCRELELKVIAEGIETREECLTLQDEGVTLFQGYLFSRPAFQSLPPVPPEVFELVKPRRQHDRKSRYPS